MDRYRSARPIAVSASVAIALVAVLALIAGGVLGRAPNSAGPSASQPPSAPSADPSAKPTRNPATPPPSAPIATPAPSDPIATPQPEPADDASDGVDEVDVFNWPGVRSTVVVWDETDSLADASSGRPGRPASVAYDKVEIDAVDDDTVRLTWSDLPIENRVRLSIRHDDIGKFLIRLVRPRAMPPSDGVVSDRVLVLDFNVAVPAEDVDVELVESVVPSNAVGIVGVGLATPNEAPSSVMVWDETDGLADAVTGNPDGGASVDHDDVALAQVDDDTVRLTWTALPAENEARLSIRMAEDGTYLFRLVRIQEHGPTDTMVTDRILILDFNVAIAADDIDVTLIDTMDNNG